MTRPIIMDGASIRAILAGEKSQTRRVMKPQPPEAWAPNPYDRCGGYRSPYGQRGDLLWVRETWRVRLRRGVPVVEYRADVPDRPPSGHRWRSPIHMPKTRARLWLRATDIRVERLQVVTPEDCVAEGVTADMETHAGPYWRDQVVRDFSTRWDALNAKRGYPWRTNPWVWVVTFERAAAP